MAFQTAGRSRTSDSDKRARMKDDASSGDDFSTLVDVHLRATVDNLDDARVARLANRSRERSERLAKVGGEGGIRTPGTVPGSVVFKTTAIDHSATSPC
jgi:hypothetical protein